MNTITLTIAATPDNFRRLVAAFGDIIDENLDEGVCPAHRVSSPQMTPEIMYAETLPGAQASEPQDPAAADALQEPEATAQEPAPTPEPTITLSELRAKGAELTTGEHREELKALLNEFGAKRITELAETDYAAFYKKLEAIG